MPEGPEIYFLKKSLNRSCNNTTIKAVNILSGRYKTHGPPKGYKEFVKDLPMKITGYNNIGKFLWITTNKKWNIWITFGLTGWIERDKPEYDARVQFNTSRCNLYYTDYRNFGTIFFNKDNDALEQKIKKLGPDPLNERVSDKVFYERLMKYGKGEEIADALLDQRIISGVGNYIRAESLYKAKINPFKKVSKITLSESEILLNAIKYNLHKFVNPKADYEVYRQRITPNGEVVHNKKTKNGRTLYYVIR